MDTTQTTRLLNAAKSYAHLGWSVIPIAGDSRPDAPKTPLVEWKFFQSTRATPETFEHWFGKYTVGGIAIVCGRISKLAVLDFDNNDHYRDFQTAYPDLCETRTVKTPNGMHLLYHVHPQINLRTMKVPGIDLLFNGAYAITYPTEIDGQRYELTRSGQHKTLSHTEAKQIMTFVEERGRSQVITPEVEAIIARVQQGKAPQDDVPPISEMELRGLYSSRAMVGQRNQTLFDCAIQARDAGWTEERVHQVLAPLHVNNQAPESTESATQRFREATATIRSAFSRPARKHWFHKDTGDMPNLLKEYFFQQGWTCLVRVLVGLRKLGVQAGQYVTRTFVLDSLTGIIGIGRHSIDKTLRLTTPDGRLLFEPQDDPLPSENRVFHFTPQTPYGVATADAVTYISKCLEISDAKPYFSDSGKTPTPLRVPSYADLFGAFGIEPSRIADELTLDDLKSAKQTRMASLRGFLKRRPGKYARKFLAKLVGKSVATKNRYDNALPDLHKKATYLETPLFWHNLDEIPDDEIGGVFLIDETGKKYPAKQGIATRLLGQGKRVSLMKQWYNDYWVGNKYAQETSQPVTKPAATPSAPVSKPLWDALVFTQPPVDEEKGGKTAISDALGTGTAKHGKTGFKTAEKASTHQEQSKKPARKPRRPKTFRRKLRDAYLEEKANLLKKRINAITDPERTVFSIVSARQLIWDYGCNLVLWAMHQVEYKHSKGKADHPPALLVTIARSEWKKRQYLQELLE